MLTKDQLKYTVRGDKVFPKYVKPSDPEATGFAKFLVEVYRNATGKKFSELSDVLKKHPKSTSVVFGGLNKLLEDRCEFLMSEEAVEEQRWSVFLRSKSLRTSEHMTIADFKRRMEEEFRVPFSEMSANLYSDLPEFRIISGFSDITPEALLHRYNSSQIQGLILRSRSLTIIVRDKDPIKKRRLLQRLKFWRLLAEIDENPEHLTLSISGPLSMFDSSSTYGSRLSNFFPHVVLMDKWEIRAEIRMDDKTLLLEVDSSKPIKSHYQSMTGHVPPEFKAFISLFNELSFDDRRGYKAMEGEDVLNLGSQNYVVPDITFQNETGKRIHLELFHKWHEFQLNQRVEVLSRTADPALIIGVAGDLMPKDKLKETLDNSPSKNLKMFAFKRFPTPKAILAYLS